MGGPDAFSNCPLQTALVLLVVSLFILGCVVPSFMGSTVDIRRQSEETHDLSKHITAEKKKGKNQVGLCVPLSLPALLQIANPRN